MNIAAFRTVILGMSFLVLFPACNKLSDLKNQYYLSHSEAYPSEGLVPHAEHHDAEPSSHGEESHQVDHQEGHQTEHHGEHKIVVTSPVAKDVVSTQQYVCQIHSWRHIEVCALEGGYLETIAIQEGQRVKQGELLFKILPTLYEARLESDMAEAQLAQIELQNTERLFEQNIVAQPEVALAKAKLAKAQAKVNLAQAELNFATIRAPFDGIVDKQHEQQGSLIEEGDVLTTLSDNSTM